jgi:hypothetical protein
VLEEKWSQGVDAELDVVALSGRSVVRRDYYTCIVLDDVEASLPG